jgi:two-component system response regulator HydG
MAEGLARNQAPRELRGRLERALCDLLHADRVSIRDGTAPPDLSRQPGIAATIPVPRPFRARLEAVGNGRGPFDAWDRQLLRAASSLAAVVLALERTEGATDPIRHDRQQGADGPGRLLGSSDAIKAVVERVERVAAIDFTVLIEGETGTGKELVARQIHERSRRRRAPFVAVNCAALVETLIEAELFGIEDRTATGVRGRQGRFEHADRGTLFLDEVSDLSMSAQAKLLRAVQDMSVERVGGQGARRVDARIIAASNRSLARMVAEGRFRRDLFHRLAGVEVVVPPLRQRSEDISTLAEAFLARHRAFRRLTFSATATDALKAYHWPGNVRELERVVERAVALAPGERIELADLPLAICGDFADALVPAAARDETLRAWAGRYARLILERHGNNKRRACEALGISYHTLRAHLGHRSPKPAQLRKEDEPGLLTGLAARRRYGPT